MEIDANKLQNTDQAHLAGYKQQDAHEFLQFILNSIHSTNGGTFDQDCPCFVHKTFGGKLQSTVTCDKCKTTSITSDPFLDLSLDLRAQIKKKKLNNGESGAAHDRLIMNL